MEEKLKEFHQKKRRERIWDTITLKSFMESWKPSSPTTGDISVAPASPAASPSSRQGSPSNFVSKDTTEKSPLHRTLSNESIVSITSSNASADWSCNEWSHLTIITYSLYTLLWLTCWLIAVQLRFGAVYFVFSGLFGIYLNTRTGPRRAGEMSAYSVFNPNCQAIDGTLKAEQFEKEFNLIHHSPS